jgi:subfamily B ATP-binding cassette protein MsbA
MRITTLVRPHWKALTLALVAVAGETIADVLQPWPIKVVIDNVVQSKKLPPWLDAWVAALFAGNNAPR